MEEKLKYYLALSRIQKIGPARWHKLLNYFKDPENIWKSNQSELTKAGIEENLAQEIICLRHKIDPQTELENVIKQNIKILLIQHDSYPKLLKEIYNPPILLYYRGSLDWLNQFCLAVVGTRKYSSYGKQLTQSLVRQLTEQNITIISGLALGIDALAHGTALECQGRTIAILGSGLDWPNIYPAANHGLAQKIIDSGGAIISEYPIGTRPTTFTFPMRNRIISGLSLGTLIIEAPASSGALITAKYATEQNREVFAVPGNIYSSNSAGTNKLIKQGAKMVTGIEDIIEELQLDQTTNFIKSQQLMPQSAEEEIILKILSQEALHIDKIAISSKLKINVLSGILTMMEMKGLVRDLGGKNYIIAK